MSKLDHLYDTARWRRLRAHQLREHPLCRFCLEGRGMVTLATVADHVIAHKGDINKFWLGELQSLCHQCHVSTKAFIEQRGYSPMVGLDGYPVDKNHPCYQSRKGT